MSCLQKQKIHSLTTEKQMNNFIKLLMTFLEELPMEDLTHLKYTMKDTEIERYLEEWITENALNLIPSEIKSVSPAKGKILPMNKTYRLTVIVEDEEYRPS